MTADAIIARNIAWEGNSAIPKWVNVAETGLDQFFTKPEVAATCFASLQAYLPADKRDTGTFLEPSAGRGAFYDLLPLERRVGVDIVPYRSSFHAIDFLSWSPESDAHNFIAIGNPPFGYRAWLALAFLNRALKFCSVVGMILPMAFQSRGKGNPQDRVVGGSLVVSESLPPDSFLDAGGRAVRVNCLWQIWDRDAAPKSTKHETCNDYVDIFTVDQRKARLCGQARMAEANFFLQRTFYSQAPTLVTSFDQVRYVCGYGIVLKREAVKVQAALLATDWRKYSNLAAHNCRHISMCHIRAALIDAGFLDRK